MLALVVVVVLVVVSAAAFVVYEKFNGNLTSVSLKGKFDRPSKTVTDAQGHRPLNILFMGSDTRAGADASYGSNDHAPLSDSTMLLHVDAERDHAYVVSIPRDTMIKRPSCPALKGGTAPAEDPVMFNTALAVGGPACTVHTVEKMTGLFIDHFIEVDFQGFKKIVDAVGGVDVCLPNNVSDYHSKLYLTKGRHHIDGAQALAFARERYQVGNGGDLGRIKLQQQLVGSLLTKVHSDGVLFNPARLYALGDTATKSITADSDLASVGALLSLGRDLRSVPPAKISFVTMPTEAYVRDPNRLQPAEPTASQLWAALRNDTMVTGPAASPGATPSAPATPSPSGAAPPVSPSTVSLVVLNGTATTGRGTAVASSLKQLGFQVGFVGNARASGHTTTLVEYPIGQEKQARTVQQAIPGAQLMQAPGLLAVTLVVGEQSTVAPLPAGPGSAADSPTPAPSPTAIPSGIPTRVATADVCTTS